MRATTKLLLTSAASLVVTSTAACGPAGAPVAPNVTAPIAKPVAVAAPTRARWVFSRPERGLTAKLDLGGGQTLFVGQYGRRALAKGDEPLVDAPTLALEHLVGVLRESNGDFAFVADDGDVYVSHDPLGTLDVVRNGPLGEAGPDGKAPTFTAITTGRASIVGLTEDGRMLRSTDYGKQWSPVDYAGAARPFGRAVSVALDTRGSGLVLMFPQRLFATRDDGATWTPVASPGIGASTVKRDGADQVFMWASEHAKLEGQRLVVTRDPIEPLRKPKAGTTTPEAPTQTLLTGDRVVELTLHKGARPHVEVSSHKLGEPTAPGSSVESSDLVSATGSHYNNAESGVSSSLAGWGSTLLYARADDTKDADGAVTTTLFQSNDSGASWKSAATFKGHIASPARRGSSEARDVAVGPNGWAYVKAMCPPGSSETSDKCVHRQIRTAGSPGFEDMASVEEFAPLHFAFDEAHGRVYVLGRHEGRLHVYESALAQNKFTRTKVLDVEQGARAALTVDPSGVVRVLVQDFQNHQWKLLRHAEGAAELPVLYAPIDSGEATLVGLRGIVAGGHRSWETADGGETWVHVAASGSSGDLACTEAGCTMGGAERIGWDLPAYQGTEKVVASTEPKKTTVRPPPPRAAQPPPALDLTCKASGAAQPVPAVPDGDTVDLRASDVRWSEVKEDKDHKVSILVGGRAAVRELPLLGAEPAAPVAKPGAPPPPAPTTVRRTSVFRQPDGAVAVRAVQTPTVGATAPVDLELAWFSAATGKVARRTLPKFKPFVVSRWGNIGEARVVEGGVVYQSQQGEPLHFLRDDGKEETFPAPNNASIHTLVHAGPRWLIPSFSSGTAKVTSSDDGGKTWATRSWRLDDYGVLSLGSLGGKPTIGLVPSHTGAAPSTAMALFSLATISEDPPAPVVVAPAPGDAACDAQAATLRTALNLPSDARPLNVRFEEADKTTTSAHATERITHPTATGGICTAAYRMGYPATYVFQEPKGYSGVRFRWTTDPKDTSKRTLVAEPLACAPAAASAVLAK